jgi:GTP-binding protein
VTVDIRSVEYAGTVATPDGALPGDLPQVAFSGRSNVGKSSLINTLLRRTRRHVARVSGTPGKTQALNFYRVNDAFFLVDLPGFGYARVPASVRDSWRRLVEGYLGRREGIRGVVHLIDARRGPMDTDLKMMSYLGELGLPVLVVLTKVDKLKRQERGRVVERTMRALEIDTEQILPFSSQTGEGRDALLGALDSLLDDGERPLPGEESLEPTNAGGEP